MRGTEHVLFSNNSLVQICKFQGKINIFSDSDFFIPPLIDHSNTSFTNLEKFVTLIETVKWNPFTWDFFTVESFFKSELENLPWLIIYFNNWSFGLL